MSTPLVPPGVDINASRQPSLYAATITTWILAVIAVSLRFWSRRLTKSGFLLDDWLVVIATLIALGQSANIIVATRQGIGNHFEVLGPDFVTNFFTSLFVSEILYTLILCFAKYSILAFYKRIFAVTIKIPVYILGALVTAWGVAVIIVTIFQCHPVSGFWNRKIPAVCVVNDYAFFIGIAVPNIVTDAAILTLPVPFIFRLHRSTPQKITLIGIFMLGGFVIIISMVRLVTLVKMDLKSPDLDWNFSEVGVWSVTESNMAIVCACLPSLRPILSLILAGSPSPSGYRSSAKVHSGLFSRKGQNISSSRSQGGMVDESQSRSQRGFATLSDDLAVFHEDRHPQSQAFAAKVDNNEMKLNTGSEYDIEMQGMNDANKGICVRSDMVVDWSASK